MSIRGNAIPGAATAWLPRLLTKYVSAILYRDETIWLHIAGIDIDIISFATGASVMSLYRDSESDILFVLIAFSM